MPVDSEELPPPNLEDKTLLSDSTSSSFVPVGGHPEDAIQIINERKEFNGDVLSYIENATDINEIGDNFHIISVFGSQSTGKSTLLNALFNTNFDVMNELNRQQTTKGIWLACSPSINSNCNKKDDGNQVFVMDVEGTDGRERGEDQDFERKAALFALATSEVLIVNIWETQVGLYQGANMGLLKTVFEVNLSLFGKTKSENDEHKVLLLFVIRDHIGVTSLSSLSATLTQDLLKMWEGLNIPPELSHLKFSDFFDVTFHALSHKVLQNDQFYDDVRALGNRFVDPENEAYLYKPYYHHHIPIDGWTMYAESCWTQIDNNKDLDLPTQQILVSKFRCDEISNAVFQEFLEENSALLLRAKEEAESQTISNYSERGSHLMEIFGNTLEKYDLAASRYNKSVFEQKRSQLKAELISKLEEVYAVYANKLVLQFLLKFPSELSQSRKEAGSFEERSTLLVEHYSTQLKESLESFSLNGEIDSSPFMELFSTKTKQLIHKHQLMELNSIVVKLLKKLDKYLSKTIIKEINDPTERTWDNILKEFEDLLHGQLSKYKNEGGLYDFGLGTNDEMNADVANKLIFKSWSAFYALIHNYVSKDNVFTILKDRFEDKFRYDNNGLPRMFEKSHEVEVCFSEAKDYAMKALPILTIAKLSDDSEILPPVDIFNKSLELKYEGAFVVTPAEEKVEIEEESDYDDEPTKCFAEVLTEEEKNEVFKKFKKETDARFVEAKRSVVQHITQIPYYIYLVIMVLGWNEFIAIIRNPFFFSLLILLASGVYILYYLNLLNPAVALSQRLAEEAIVMAKAKLKEFLVDDSGANARHLSKMSGSHSSHSHSPTEKPDQAPEVSSEEAS